MPTLTYTMTQSSFTTDAVYGQLVVSGDDQHGFRPYLLLVSSIVSCWGGELRKTLTAENLDHDMIGITVDIHRNADKVNRIERIHMTAAIDGATGPIGRYERAVATAADHSSMVQTVQGCIDITYALTTTRTARSQAAVNPQ